MADYIAYLTNCLTTGDEFTTVDGHQIRNLTRFALDGFNIELIQNPDVISMTSLGPLVGQQMLTSQLVFRDVTEAAFDQIEQLTGILCELLSFAMESRIGCHGYDFPAAGQIRQRTATVGTIQTFRPPFFYRDAPQIKRFIELCYATYRNLRTQRSLNVVVDYLHQASLSNLAVEVKLSILFILLENLKHTFAHSIGLPFINGFFRNPGATAAHPGGKRTFQSLLTDMLSAVHMNASLQPLINLRNELIHSGLSALNFQQKWERIEEVETLIREYILRLLNYTGDFYPYTTTGPHTI